MAEQSATFHAIIEVINRATAPIRQINASIAGMLAPITAVKIAMGELAVQTGLTAVGEDAAFALEKVGALGRNLAALAAPIGLIAIPLSFGGVMEASKKAAEFGEALQRSHERTGVDVPVLARLHYAGKMSDIDPDVMDKALEQLNARIFKARGGQDKALDAMFTKFVGPQWRKQIGNAEDALGVISNAMRKNENAAVRQGIVLTSFGQRVGAAMTPMLLRGADAMKKFGDEFEAMYGKWTPERAQAATENAEDWKKLSAAGQGLALTIGSAITPEITKLIRPLTDWIIANKALIAVKVDHAINDIGAALKGVDWKGIGQAVKFVWGGFKGLAELLGAKWTIFLGAAVIFGPIVKSGLEAAAAVGGLTTSLGKVAIKIGLVTGLQVVGFFGDLVTGIKLAIPWVSALDLAMDANPIGAVAVAIVGLTAAIYGLYKAYKALKEVMPNSVKFGLYHPSRDILGDDEPHHLKPFFMGARPGMPGNPFLPSGTTYGPSHPAATPIITRTGGGAKDRLDVNVKFTNAPPGTVTSATPRGTDWLNLNVGKSFSR